MFAYFYLPPISPFMIAAMAAALAVLAAVIYLRARHAGRPAVAAMLALRLLAIGLLGWFLLNPSRSAPQRDQARPVLAIVLDTSASMNTADAAGRSRLDFAQNAWLNESTLARLAEHYELRLFRFDAELSPALPAELAALLRANGDRTELADSLSKLLANPADLPCGVVLISDGHPTGESPLAHAAAEARARGVPLWTVTLGGPTQVRDLALSAPGGGGFLFAGQPGRLVIRVLQSGYVGRSETRVVLEREGREVARRQVVFDGQSSADVSFDIREDAPGLVAYRARVEPLEGEASIDNNDQVCFYRVTNEQIRVLLAEAAPYWDTKFLALALRADPQVELTSVVGFSPSRRIAIRYNDHPRGRGGTPASQPAPAARTGQAAQPGEPAPPSEQAVAFPRSYEELCYYDILVFGRGLQEFYTAEDVGLLRRYLVERGGGIVFARGQAYDTRTAAQRQLAREMAAIEPAVWGQGMLTDMGLTLTSEGATHPSFSFALAQPSDVVVQRMPHLISATRLSKEKAISIVLARTGAGPAPADNPDGMAAIAYQNYGRGKVVSVITEGMWRWAFLPAELRDYDSVYAVFWANMVRWLVAGGDFLPGQQIALNVGATSARTGQAVDLQALFTHAPTDAEFRPTLTVRDPAGQQQVFALSPDHGDAPAGGRIEAVVRYTPPRNGVYVATLSAPGMVPSAVQARFAAYAFSPEPMASSAQPELMDQLSRASGGQAVPPDRPEALLQLLADERKESLAVADPQSAWPRAGWLLAILLALLAEWALRRRRQLL